MFDAHKTQHVTQYMITLSLAVRAALTYPLITVALGERTDARPPLTFRTLYWTRMFSFTSTALAENGGAFVCLKLKRCH